MMKKLGLVCVILTILLAGCSQKRTNDSNILMRIIMKGVTGGIDFRWRWRKLLSNRDGICSKWKRSWIRRSRAFGSNTEELEKELAIQKERAQTAELETSLVKGTGMNSPEMLNAKKKIQELEDLVRSRDYTKAHDYKFLVEENKKLHKKIDDLIRGEEKRINKTREAGF